jgi:hypothetical protein
LANWITTTRPATPYSSQSYGLRFDGAKNLTDNFGVVYTAKWSTQSDYRHNPNNYRANRYNVVGGVTAFGVTVSGAMEQLGGGALGGTNSFQTPLGLNHAFQGWADKFLTTPAR